METEKVDLRRERDFGEIFNSSLTFLRQEIKPFGKGILVLVLPAMVLLTLYANHLTTSSIKYDPSWRAILTGLVGLVAQTIIFTTIYSYLNLYFQKYETISLKELFIEFRYNFFRIFWALLAVLIIAAITVALFVAIFKSTVPLAGAIFAGIIVIYLMVSLSLLPSILVFENRRFGYAFSRSFTLSHMKWWNTFLILLVGGIIIVVIGILLQSPIYVIIFVAKAHDSFELYSKLNTLVIIYSSIASALIKIFYIIPAFLAAFQYFSLVEAREKPSLIDRIEEIGENE